MAAQINQSTAAALFVVEEVGGEPAFANGPIVGESCANQCDLAKVPFRQDILNCQRIAIIQSWQGNG
jgi:hypothetical protein